MLAKKMLIALTLRDISNTSGIAALFSLSLMLPELEARQRERLFTSRKARRHISHRARDYFHNI